MKKLYISADIEGVCGIANWAETELAEAQGAYFRAQMTREVRAACEAAREWGVEEVLVKDAHGSGRNLDPSGLPENVLLMRDWARNPYQMVAGIDPSFDAAMFIGYHSGAGADGNPLAHTMTRRLARILVNGRPAGEFLLNAYTLAEFGVPVILVSGDRQLCRTVTDLNPHIRTVAVNEGVGGASISIHPRLALARIQAAAAAALAGDPAACALELPDRYDLALEFQQHELAYRASFYPGAVQAGPHAVSYSCSAWLDALKFIYFVV
jgi:D-amino peptidase